MAKWTEDKGDKLPEKHNVPKPTKENTESPNGLISVEEIELLTKDIPTRMFPGQDGLTNELQHLRNKSNRFYINSIIGWPPQEIDLETKFQWCGSLEDVLVNNTYNGAKDERPSRSWTMMELQQQCQPLWSWPKRRRDPDLCSPTST